MSLLKKQPTSRATTTDALKGIEWWNSLSRLERAYWLGAANSQAPVDAWCAFKKAPRP